MEMALILESGRKFPIPESLMTHAHRQIPDDQNSGFPLAYGYEGCTRKSAAVSRFLFYDDTCDILLIAQAYQLTRYFTVVCNGRNLKLRNMSV